VSTPKAPSRTGGTPADPGLREERALERAARREAKAAATAPAGS
jgi:hypothetical protein